MGRKVILKAPVSQSLKDKVTAAATARDESEALIVREALDEYFSRRLISAVAEDQAPYGADARSPSSHPAADAVVQTIAAAEAARRAAQQHPAGGFARRDPAAIPAPEPHK